MIRVIERELQARYRMVITSISWEVNHLLQYKQAKYYTIEEYQPKTNYYPLEGILLGTTGKSIGKNPNPAIDKKYNTLAGTKTTEAEVDKVIQLWIQARLEAIKKSRIK